MKSTPISLIAIFASLTLSSPISREAFFPDTYNDMTDIISNSTPCLPLALIFARGTFDSGNAGVWVGPPLITSLQSLLPSGQLAVQGVDNTAYPATLSSYLTEHGSNSGAASMATSISSYADKCPDSAIVVSGWSQGALVVHKALAQLDEETLRQIAGVITFGDPWHLFSNESLPAQVDEGTVKGYCFDGMALDPLCANLEVGYEVPDTLEGVTGPFSELPSIAHGAQQVEAAASLIVQFPGQLLKSWGSFVADLNKEDFVRLLLTPQHFEYGNNGATEEAARFISQLPMVHKALSR